MQNQRTAIVRGASSAATVAAYLPSGYVVTGETEDENGRTLVEITGHDNAGWTLEDYIIPRLASGLMFAEEVS